MHNNVSQFEITEEVWILEGRIIKQLPVIRINVVFSERSDPKVDYNFSYKKVPEFIHTDRIEWVPEKHVFKTKKDLIDSLQETD